MVDHLLGSRPWGTTTQARLTLLDAWPDANETFHDRVPADILEDILGYFALLQHHSDKK